MDKKLEKLIEDTIKECEKNGINPAIIAAKNDDTNTLIYLYKKYFYFFKRADKDGNNIAHIAVEKNDIQLLCFVVNNIPEILYSFNNNQYSPIDLICKYNKPASLNLLSMHNINIHDALLIKRIDHENNIAHIAISNDDLELLKRVEKIAPEVFKMKNDYNLSPIELAWQKENKKAFRIASKHSKLVDLQNILIYAPDYFLCLSTSLFRDERKDDLQKLKSTVVATIQYSVNENPTPENIKKAKQLIEKMNSKIDYERAKIANKEKQSVKKNEKAKLNRRINKFIEK